MPIAAEDRARRTSPLPVLARGEHGLGSGATAHPKTARVVEVESLRLGLAGDVGFVKGIVAEAVGDGGEAGFARLTECCRGCPRARTGDTHRK